jgi:hypothetical protein
MTKFLKKELKLRYLQRRRRTNSHGNGKVPTLTTLTSASPKSRSEIDGFRNVFFYNVKGCSLKVEEGVASQKRGGAFLKGREKNSALILKALVLPDTPHSYSTNTQIHHRHVKKHQVYHIFARVPSLLSGDCT